MRMRFGPVERTGGARMLAADEDQPPRCVLAAGEQHQTTVHAHERLQRLGGQVAGEGHVGQRDGLAICGTDERDARRTAHGAASPVAAGDVTCLHLLLVTGRGSQRRGDTRPVLMARHELGAPLDGRTVPFEVVAQYRLGLGLAEDEQEREGRVRQPGVAHRDRDLAPAQVEPRPGVGVAARQQARRHADRAEHLERSRLQHERTRRSLGRRPTVDDPHAGAEGTQLRRQRQPRMPVITPAGRNNLRPFCKPSCHLNRQINRLSPAHPKYRIRQITRGQFRQLFRQRRRIVRSKPEPGLLVLNQRSSAALIGLLLAFAGVGLHESASVAFDLHE